MSVPLQEKPRGSVDVYIDDKIGTMDVRDNLEQLWELIPLAFHIIVQPVAKTVPKKVFFCIIGLSIFQEENQAQK